MGARPIRCLFLWLVLFAFGAGLAAMVWSGWWGLHLHYRRAIVQRTAEARRLQAIADSRAVLETRSQALAERQGQTPYLLTGRDANLVGVALHRELHGLLADEGIQAKSIQDLPARPQGDLQQIRLRLRFTAMPARLVGFLHAVEGHRPFLFVDRLVIQATSRRLRPLHPGESIPPNGVQVDIDIHGLMKREGA